MKTALIRDVMSRPVVTVSPETSYKAIVDLLIEYGVSGVPVVDGTGGVLGVVSETDLLRKVALGVCGHPRPHESRQRRQAREKACGLLAAELMTWPAIVVEPGAAVVDAARMMESWHVKRLPVVSTAGDLVGIVARSDLLRLFLQPDEELRHEIVGNVLRRVLRLRPTKVSVSVSNGVVTLAGRVERRSSAELAARLTQTVPGVVDVIDRLAYTLDDAAPDDAAPEGVGAGGELLDRDR